MIFTRGLLTVGNDGRRLAPGSIILLTAIVLALWVRLF